MLKDSRDLAKSKNAKQKNLQKSRFLDFKFLIIEFKFLNFPSPQPSPRKAGRGGQTEKPLSAKRGEGVRPRNL
jgi:hypothetical protein